MHDSALATGAAFFQTYGRPSGLVLDIGSLDVNGTLRPCIPNGMDYCGCDTEAGPNVSVVLDNPYQLPFANEEAEIVISTSCFEHSEFFCLSFVDMCRVVKLGGLVYMSAPTNGPYHRHPVDCWRFYPDAGRALTRWAARNNEPMTLLESFVLPPAASGWSDFVAVWAKRPFAAPTRFLHSCFPAAMHIANTP